jgi:Ca-activated chloride channel homolog
MRESTLALAICVSVGIAFPPVTENTAAARQSHGQVLKVETQLQTIAVRVTDKKGQDIKGLTAEDFEVLEDGRPQKIAFFGTESVPTSLSVLVDSSGTMDQNSKFGSAGTVAAQFMRGGRQGDEVSAMDFTDELGPYQQLTPEQLLNPSSVPLVSGNGQGAALYDAVAAALCHLRSSKNLRQAVVVITDGADQHSRISLDQLIGLLQSSRAQLFMIAWHSLAAYGFNGHFEKRLTLVSGHEMDNPIIVFERLTKESGAESFVADSEDGLVAALKKVSDLLQAQYTLAYYPEGTSKTLRRIQVKVRRPGLVATSRRSVGSESGPYESVHFVEGSCTVSPEAHPYPYESHVKRDDGRLVYRENFSDSSSGWPNRPGSRYASGGYELSNLAKPETLPVFESSNGGRQLVTPYSDVERNVIAAYGPWWVDFRASVIVSPFFDVKPFPKSVPKSQSPGPDRSAAGLVFRLNVDGYYAVLVSGVQGGKEKELFLKLVKAAYGHEQETIIVPWTLVRVPEGSEERIKLSVESVGSQITLSVNDQQVDRVQDDSFAQGLVGFVQSEAGRAVFQDLVVEELR